MESTPTLRFAIDMLRVLQGVVHHLLPARPYLLLGTFSHAALQNCINCCHVRHHRRTIRSFLRAHLHVRVLCRHSAVGPIARTTIPRVHRSSAHLEDAWGDALYMIRAHFSPLEFRSILHWYHHSLYSPYSRAFSYAGVPAANSVPQITARYSRMRIFVRGLRLRLFSSTLCDVSSVVSHGTPP